MASAIDEALVFPGAQDPADRVERRAGHLGDVPARDRKADLDTSLDRLPGLLREVTRRYADREALVFHHPDGRVERWSYAELWDRAMRVARALVACGFSGHGFKLAPAVGAALAELALDGRTDPPIDFLSPRRFFTP